MDLNVESSGSGRDMVLLHGWGMHSGIWRELAQELVQDFRVHAVDLPGHGGSPVCDPYTLERITHELALQMPQSSTVCGWSLGGQVALNWALHAPHQVERLVLIATTPCFVNGAHWDSGIDAAIFDELARDVADDGRAALQRFLALQAQNDADARVVLRRLRGMLLERSEPTAATLAAGLRILRETELRDRLPGIAQPVLILHGECDAVVPLAAGAYLQRTLPRAELEVCAGSAHAPFVAHPGRAARRIVEFCREQ